MFALYFGWSVETSAALTPSQQLSFLDQLEQLNKEETGTFTHRQTGRSAVHLDSLKTAQAYRAQRVKVLKGSSDGS